MGYGFRKEGFKSFGGPREMHKIKCSECGKDAEVPFKPRGDSPVYCKECFLKRKGIKPREQPEKSEDEEKSEETKEEAEEEDEDSDDEF